MSVTPDLLWVLSSTSKTLKPHTGPPATKGRKVLQMPCIKPKPCRGLSSTADHKVVRTQEALSIALETRQRQLLMQTLEKYQRERETRGPAENEDGTSG